MKQLKKNYSLFCLLVVFSSCSNDDDASVNEASEVFVAGFTETRSSISTDGSNYDFKSVLSGRVVDNKIIQKTEELFYNGVSAGVSVIMDYSYSNGNLVKVRQYNESNTTHQFFYDLSNNFVGAEATFNGQSQYYRFINSSSSEVICEKISAPYNDLSAVIIYRYIVAFDINDNVVKCGIDANLDGEADYRSTYTYSNNNLISINGITNYSNSYRPFKDTYQFLEDASYGKRLRRLLCFELFESGHNLNYFSENIINDETDLSFYEAGTNGFLKKKTENSTNVENYRSTTELEFFFN